MIGILLLSLFISFFINIFFFVFAFVFRTDKFTDLSYGLSFVVISLFLFLNNLNLETFVLFVLIFLWGMRLSFYLVARILKTGRDERFDEIRNDFLKFLRFFIFQAIAVWVVLLPSIMVFKLSSPSQFLPLQFVALALWTFGFLIEAIADQQKYKFKSRKENSNKWVDAGLWKYSRHPNYFGEMVMWGSLFLFSLPYLSGSFLLAAISPIFIIYILLFVSGVPPLEKKYDEKFGNDKKYQEYKRKTRLILPLPN